MIQDFVINKMALLGVSEEASIVLIIGVTPISIPATFNVLGLKWQIQGRVEQRQKIDAWKKTAMPLAILVLENFARLCRLLGPFFSSHRTRFLFMRCIVTPCFSKICLWRWLQDSFYIILQNKTVGVSGIRTRSVIVATPTITFREDLEPYW